MTFKIKKTKFAILLVSIITVFFTVIQRDKYLQPIFEESYFLSPDELYYVAISDSRFQLLMELISGNVLDFNINIFALFSNYVATNYGLVSLLSLNLSVLFLFLHQVSRSNLELKWKFFLILNPIVPYVATSFMRDIYIYALIVLLLNTASRRIIVSPLHAVLGVLRPATLSLIILYQSFLRSRILFSTMFAVFTVSIIVILGHYSKVIDPIETQKRVAQVFGLDLFFKLNPKNFAQLIDLLSTIYCLLFWTYIFSVSFKASVKRFPVSRFFVILFILQLYSLLYASYLGFFVGRTLFPLLIVISFVAGTRRRTNH